MGRPQQQTGGGDREVEDGRDAAPGDVGERVLADVPADIQLLGKLVPVLTNRRRLSHGVRPYPPAAFADLLALSAPKSAKGGRRDLGDRQNLVGGRLAGDGIDAPAGSRQAPQPFAISVERCPELAVALESLELDPVQ